FFSTGRSRRREIRSRALPTFPPRTPDHGHRLPGGRSDPEAGPPAASRAGPLFRRAGAPAHPRAVTPSPPHPRPQQPRPSDAAAGKSYVYRPTVPRTKAARPALANVLNTFFDGSTEKAVAALLDISRPDLSEEDLDRLSRLIEQAREEGR